MRRFWIAILPFTLCPVGALAADDIMAGTYGNTLVATGGIAETHTHYRADHTFDITARALLMTYNFKGTWKIDEKGDVCLTFVEPLPPRTTNPACRPATGPHKAGDTWTTTRNGNTRTMTIVAGIE